MKSESTFVLDPFVFIDLQVLLEQSYEFTAGYVDILLRVVFVMQNGID